MMFWGQYAHPSTRFDEKKLEGVRFSLDFFVQMLLAEKKNDFAKRATVTFLDL